MGVASPRAKRAAGAIGGVMSAATRAALLCSLVLGASACSRSDGHAVSSLEKTPRVAAPSASAFRPQRETTVHELPDAAVTAETPAAEWTAGIVHRSTGRSAVATLRALRFARHEAFERVVFDLDGAGLPGRHVEYIDEPVRSCGSGDPVPLEGDAWLAITLEPAAAHDEAGHPTISNREVKPGFPIIREIELTCDFEAKVTVVLGVARPNRYRVLELDHPPRIVFDIRR